jgi:hypothetical protein
MARKHEVALEAKEAVAANACRYAPSIPTCLASRKKEVHEHAVTS